jgi:cytochrome c biogenesis protein ResB
VEVEWFYVAVVIVMGISMVCGFLLKRQYQAMAERRKKARSRAIAHNKFLHHHSVTDQPKHEFKGSEAVIVFQREDFVIRNGKEEPTFIFLSRNAFDEYFFCVIDLGLSMVHLPKERALSFLKDFPAEYADEIEYLVAKT